MVNRPIILGLLAAAVLIGGCQPAQPTAQQKLSGALAQRQASQLQAQRLFEQGRALLDQDKPKDAAGRFRAAVGADDRHAPSWIGLGAACYRQQDWPGALEAFDRAKTLCPHRVEPHYNLGMTLEAMGQYTRAIDCYERALKINPDHLEAAENLVRCLVVTRSKSPRALELVQKALTVETRPEWRDWLTLQSSLLAKRAEPVVMNPPVPGDSSGH